MDSPTQTQWTVITGAPSAGKTTTLAELQKLGYLCRPEPGTILIESRLAKGETLKQICSDQPRLQREILEQGLRMEAEISPDEPYFLDRSAADTLAYCQQYNIDDMYFREQVTKKRYKHVLLLDDLPFVKNHVRIEDDEDAARRVSRYLEEAYVGLGYNVIHVPPVSIDERITFILSHTL